MTEKSFIILFFFCWNVYIEIRDEFHTKIVKVKNEAEFKVMIPYLEKFMKNYKKTFVHNINLLCHKL